MATSSSSLPEDAIMEILARLPVKSLIRFTSVCKSWYSLIKNPNFITKLLSDNTTSCILLKHNIAYSPSLSLLSHETLEVSSIDVQLPFFGDDALNVIFYGPCNGIICLHILSRGTLLSHEDLTVLWNPATRDFNVLPISDLPRPEKVGILGIEFGFGFDLISNDYKVVKIIDFFHLETRDCDYPSQVEVYDLSTGSWREIKDAVVPTSVRATLSFSAYLNGCYYWWAGDKDGVLSFDMSNEVFGLIPGPDMTVVHYGVKLVEFNESIGLIVDNAENPGYDIWVMNEDGVGKSWFKQFSIVRSPEFVCLEGVLNRGKAIVRDSKGKFAIYDPSTRKCGDLQLPVSEFSGWCQVVFFRESLVSVKGGNGLSLTR